MLFKKKRKVLSLQIDEDLCSGCGNCMLRCRRNVITLMNDKSRMVAVVNQMENCKGCRHWLEVCRQDAIELVCK